MKQRIDAALRFAGLSQEGLEEKIEMSRSTLNRRRNGGYDFRLGELFEIAEETGVPVWFLRWGWDGWRRELSADQLREIADSLPLDDPPDN